MPKVTKRWIAVELIGLAAAALGVYLLTPPERVGANVHDGDAFLLYAGAVLALALACLTLLVVVAIQLLKLHSQRRKGGNAAA